MFFLSFGVSILFIQGRVYLQDASTEGTRASLHCTGPGGWLELLRLLQTLWLP